MNVVRLNISRTLALLVLFFMSSANGFGLEQLVPSLRLSISGEKIISGSCLNGPRDFAKSKFQIVDQNGNGLSYFEILEGSITTSKGKDQSGQGSVLASGLLHQSSVDLLKNASGERVAVFVKVLDKSNDSIVNLTMQFFVNVEPTIVIGNVTQGQKDVDPNMIAMMESLYLEFSENPKLIKFKIISGAITVEGLNKNGKVLGNGVLDKNGIELLKESAGKQVTIVVLYSDPSGLERRTALVFRVAEV